MRWNANAWRRWCRHIHRELSYFLAGTVIVYAVSGIAMNHRDTFNPDYSVERSEMSLDGETLAAEPSRERIGTLLDRLGIEAQYVKHYSPEAGRIKVFLRGGSSLAIDTASGKCVYEKLERRYLLSAMTRLHFNPGGWWTRFSDLFAGGLILVTITGLFLLKGPKGLWGRGGIELLAGIAVPVLFFLFFIN